MPDIVSVEKRSQMMSGIKGKNTKPELIVRSILHRAGFRFRLHDKKLPGKPDLVLVKHKVVLFIHGCFWHGHECSLFKRPSSNSVFWDNKISGNQKRDLASIEKLINLGWRVRIVWECSLRGKDRISDEVFVNTLKDSILSVEKFLEIRGLCQTEPSPNTSKQSL